MTMPCQTTDVLDNVDKHLSIPDAGIGKERSNCLADDAVVALGPRIQHGEDNCLGSCG